MNSKYKKIDNNILLIGNEKIFGYLTKKQSWVDWMCMHFFWLLCTCLLEICFTWKCDVIHASYLFNVIKLMEIGKKSSTTWAQMEILSCNLFQNLYSFTKSII